MPRYSIKYKNKVFRDGIILKQNLTAKGYLTVSLYNNGKPKRFTVHRLVGGAFISNPNNLPQINHKDEDKTNNCVENLEWCTQQYNNIYGNRIAKMVEKKSIKIVQLDVKGNYIRTWKNIEEVGRQLNISGSVMIGCCNNTYKTAAGYKWMYYDDYSNDVKVSKIKYNFRNKPFIQLKLDGTFVKEWYSIPQIHKELGFGVSSISLCLNGKKENYKGYNWVYASEYYKDFDDTNKTYSNNIGYDYLMKIAATRKIM